MKKQLQGSKDETFDKASKEGTKLLLEDLGLLFYFSFPFLLPRPLSQILTLF